MLQNLFGSASIAECLLFLGSSVHGILQDRILEWIVFLSPGDLPNPGIEPRSPTVKANSLSAEPPGKPLMGITQD